MKKIPGRNGGTLVNFEKGEVSNPNGRPVGSKNRSTLLKYWLSTPTTITNPETGEKIKCTLEDKIALALIKKCMSGDVPAIKEALDTMYGKQKETHEVEQKTELKITVVDNDTKKELEKLLKKDADNNSI